MFGSAWLDVGIGLMFVYLVLSLVCMGLAELIELFTRARARYLFYGIRNMLGDERLAHDVYNHPLIQGAAQGDEIRSRPSYIPSRNFASALLDVVLAGGNFGTPPGFPPYGRNWGPPGSGPAVNPEAIRLGLSNIQSPRLQRVLLTVLDSTGDYPMAIRPAIETWFDDAMEQVSGWYKRRVQVIVTCLALLLAAGMNADTLALMSSPSQNARVALAATARLANPDPSQSQRLTDLLNTMSTQVTGSNIGWTDQSFVASPLVWATRLFGWLITACAVSLLAPLCFDLLSRVALVRSAVLPHGSSAAEANPARVSARIDSSS